MKDDTQTLIIAVPGDERLFDRKKIPPQWAYIGTVQKGGEDMAGVLVRNTLSGAYGQVFPDNPSHVRPLDRLAVALGFAENACPGGIEAATVDMAGAAALVNRSRQTIGVWVKDGLLKPYNTTGVARYLKNSVLAVAANRPSARGKKAAKNDEPDHTLTPAANSVK
jgi:hypothetical protein